MQFIDKVEIRAIAGNGGNGLISFLREKYRPFGGPSGGDGGRGGHVYFQADQNINTLYPLRQKTAVRAHHGTNGGRQKKAGSKGESITIFVPVGTVIYDAVSHEMLADLNTNNLKVRIARGGAGGRGNANFATSKNRAPRTAENGDLGENKLLSLQLKSIADVGLIGFPNEGKSTFISLVSRATPQIAPYPFTTLTPVLGTVFLDKHRHFTMADVPGLIAGASHGKGLGHTFLKHVERCRVLVFVLAMEKLEGFEPFERFQIVAKELRTANPELLAKKRFYLATKMDLVGAETRLQKFRSQIKAKVYESSIENESSQNNLFIHDLWEACQEKEVVTEEPLTSVKVYEYRDTHRGQDIIYEQIRPKVWRVSGPDIDYLCNKIPLVSAENMLRFNHQLQKWHVEDNLKKKGANVGETLFINDTEFEID